MPTLHRWTADPVLRAGAELALLLLLSAPAQGAAPHAAAIKRSSSAIAITPDGATLLVVNPDSNSLTLIATADGSVLAEVSAGVDPRTAAVDAAGARAYVANRGSDSVTVIDLAARRVVAEVPTGDRPYGVVVSPDGDRVYVAEQGAGRVRIFDAATLETIALVPVAARPSGLAITDDGRTLLVTHLLANSVTFLTVRPYALYLPVVMANAPAPHPPPYKGGGATPVVYPFDWTLSSRLPLG
jgi:YVTN family beta-propeller protein